MRAFIDARDLINIFNHSQPVSPSDLAEVFVRANHQLVLPFSLISELVPADNNLLVVARRFVKIEEDVPHVFLQQKSLAEEEIRRAALDVSNSRAPDSYNPYVDTFRELWGGGFDPIFLMDLDRTIGMHKMAFQIELLVEQAPEIFHWSRREAEKAVRILEREQEAIKKGSAKDAFRDTVVRWLTMAGLEGSESSVTKLADALRRNPTFAPGWRLYTEVFDQLARDKGYKPTVNDVWDLANVTMLPYVDALTLDKNKIDLVRRATQRLKVVDSTINYPSRAFGSVRDLLARLGL